MNWLEWAEKRDEMEARSRKRELLAWGKLLSSLAIMGGLAYMCGIQMVEIIHAPQKATAWDFVWLLTFFGLFLKYLNEENS
jgi:hypothetical protein